MSLKTKMASARQDSRVYSDSLSAWHFTRGSRDYRIIAGPHFQHVPSWRCCICGVNILLRWHLDNAKVRWRRYIFRDYITKHIFIVFSSYCLKNPSKCFRSSHRSNCAIWNKYTVKPIFKTTWEIGTTWEIRTATSVPRHIHLHRNGPEK